VVVEALVVELVPVILVIIDPLVVLVEPVVLAVLAVLVALEVLVLDEGVVRVVEGTTKGPVPDGTTIVATMVSWVFTAASRTPTHML